MNVLDSNTDLLQDQIRVLIEQFKMRFDRLQKQLDMEDVHQLRVSIKKLRAFWALSGVIGGLPPMEKKLKKSVRRLFKQAGLVRECQVNIHMLAKYNRNYLKPFKQWLHTQNELAQSSLKIAIAQFDEKALIHFNENFLIALTRIPVHQIFGDSMSFIRQKFENVDKLKSASKDRLQLHEIRKELKALHAVLKVIHMLPVRTGLKKMDTKIDRLNDALGDWHDLEVLIHTLKQYPGQLMPEKSIDRLKKFIHSQENRHLSQKQAIINRLDKVMVPENRRRIEKWCD